MVTKCKLLVVLRKMKFIYFTILVSAFFGFEAFAQYPNTSVVAVEPDLLSNSYVRTFFKDSQGFMWIGMADGLIRYDGTNTFMYEHKPGDQTSLCHNTINAIAEDTLQRLWIGTAKGLAVYDRSIDSFIDVDSIDGIANHLSNRFITSLAFDQKNHLWIGTHGNGLNIYNLKTQSFVFLEDSTFGKNTVSTNYINCLLLRDNVMWCGTKGGLKTYSTTKNEEIKLPFSDEGFPKSQITQMLADKEGNIWLSTLDGKIFQVEARSGFYTYENKFSGATFLDGKWNTILTMAKDDFDNIWISGDNSGLNYFNTKDNKIIQYQAEKGSSNMLPTNSIRCVYIDDKGLTWIGTFNKGAFLISNKVKKFQRYDAVKKQDNLVVGNDARSFVEDHHGNIWITFDGIGLNKFDVKTQTLQNCQEINRKLDNHYLLTQLVDNQNNLWVGSVGKGVYKINLDSKDVINYELKSGGFGDNRIYCLYRDNKGRIWAGTSGSGLFYFDETKNEFVNLYEPNKTDHIPNTSYVSSMVEDADGVFWVSTMYGLYALERQMDDTFNYRSFFQSDQKGSVSSNSIQTVKEDNRGNLWIGTVDNGLNLKTKGKYEFSTFQNEKGFASKNIKAITMAKNGDVWISSKLGLSKYNHESNTFTTYTKEDGLASNNFYNNACLTSSSGKLYFGSNNGFNVFYPDSIQHSSDKHKIYLTDLIINNQSTKIGSPDSPLEKHISLTSEIELSFDQRSFRIDFAAINYDMSFIPKYCYMLKGFDESWNCIGTNHSATYTNLDPGHYVFLARVLNNEENQSDSTVELEITISPMIWKTWWAVLIYFIVISGVAYFLIKMQLVTIKMKSLLELERLAREKEHELTESQIQFFTNISHEFRTPLSLIAMPLESLLAIDDLSVNVKERLSTIHSSSDKLMRLVNELMDFNKLENAQLKLQVEQTELLNFITEKATIFNELAFNRNIHFGIHSMVRSIEGWIDKDKFDKILVNVLSNAFRFTADNGQINLIINIQENNHKDNFIKGRYLELIIIDDGIGISDEELPFIFDKYYQAKSNKKLANPGTGIGLSLTKSLVLLHRGSIEVESKPNQETKFIVKIPIDKEVFLENEICENPASSINRRFSPELIVSISENQEDEAEHHKAQILLVEDNYELRKYISFELQKQFNVIEANNGQEGLDCALELSPDLIISDILMPVKSGLDLCDEIKANIKTSHIPIILLTAVSRIEDQIKGIGAGADVYITKPFSIRFLLAQVIQIIESRQKLYAKFSQDVYLLPSKVTNNEMDQSFLQKAIDYIIDNIRDPQLSVESIAELFNMSRMQVYRKIKALTGNTVVDFIRMVRIKQAVKLMDTKKYTLSEIAHLTGFNTASYFTRCFKDQYGKAPSEYLDQLP
jgi:signal transduction histidine kinase/ligand-binding sensor domain-containing protein/DNA-binding response OmpR family regulator